MLHIIHKYKRSIIGVGVTFFLVILMVGFGLNPSTLTDRNTPAATVDKIEISQLEYFQERQRVEGLLRQQLGDQFNQFRQILGIEQRAIDSLITVALVKRYADDLGLSVGIKQMEKRLLKEACESSGHIELHYH